MYLDILLETFCELLKAQNMIYDDEHRYAHKMSIRKKLQRKSFLTY